MKRVSILLNLEAYEQRLDAYGQRRWQADRPELPLTRKQQFWQYQPSVGLVLPTGSWNPCQIFQVRRDRKILTARPENLDERYRAGYAEARAGLRVAYPLKKFAKPNGCAYICNRSVSQGNISTR